MGEGEGRWKKRDSKGGEGLKAGGVNEEGEKKRRKAAQTRRGKKYCDHANSGIFE